MRKSLTAVGLILLLSTAVPAAADWEAGTQAFQSGNYAGALAEFQAVADAQPDWPGGHYMLGQTLLKLKRNKEAVGALERADQLQPGQAAYQLVLGKAYVESGRFGDASKTLGLINAAGLPKAQQGIYNQLLAVAQTKSGDTAGALATLAKAASASPGDASIQYQYGTAALNAGETAKAVSALEKAVKLDGSADKQKVLTQALIKRAREVPSGKEQLYGKAVSSASSLASSKPSYENYLLLGETQLGAKRYADAIRSFQTATQKNAGDWYAPYYTGQAQTSLSQYPAAIDSLKQALSKTSSSSNQAKIYSQLGFVYEKQKAFDDAIDAYQRAGNSAGVNRVAENKKTYADNREADEINAEIERIKAEEAKLKAEIEALEDGGF